METFEEPDLIITKSGYVKCVIPGCKNKGKEIHNMCKKHSETYHFEKPDECPVCMETLINEAYPLQPCGHWVHYNCVLKSKKDQCPVCRTDVLLSSSQQKELNRLQKEEEEEKNNSIEGLRRGDRLHRFERMMMRMHVPPVYRLMNNHEKRTFTDYLDSERRDHNMNIIVRIAEDINFSDESRYQAFRLIELKTNIEGTSQNYGDCELIYSLLLTIEYEIFNIILSL